MKKNAKFETLYHEVLYNAQEDCLSPEPPDRVEVSVDRWHCSSTDESLVVLRRLVVIDWKTILDTKQLIADAASTAKLQRIGIRVFDELKAAHPTLCNE